MIKYSILINNNGSWQYIYKAGTDAMVTGAKLNLALNDAGSLEFTVPPTNALHDMLFERQTKIQVQKNGEEYWYGYVLDTEENSRKEVKVYCVGELSYLNDTIQPQARYQHQTPLQLFTAYLTEHNAQSDEQFVVGQVTVEDPNDDVYRYTNLESTLTALREDLCESLQGYLRIRRVNGIRYLDLVKISDYRPQAEQPIQFGYNLLDYACNITAVDIATACRPKGARLETQEIEGLDSYVDIKSVNDGIDFVQDSTAVANFGMIKKVVSWDNVNEPQILKEKAEQWLSENQYSMLTLKLNAIDMAVLVNLAGTWKEYDNKTWTELLSKTWDELATGEQQVQSFNVGDRVRAIADPYGMNARFPIYSVTIDLQDYSKTVYTLSNTQPSKSFTQMASSNVSAIEKNLNDASSFLNQFIRNQTDIINNTEGYYTIQKNDHAMTGWTIADSESPEQAQNLIKATLGGIGISDDGGETYKTAITGQGIVADAIKVGKISADHLDITGTSSFYADEYTDAYGVVIMPDKGNMFNRESGYAQVVSTFTYFIGGTYTDILFGTTDIISQATSIKAQVESNDNLYKPTLNGYIFLTGSDGTSNISVSKGNAIVGGWRPYNQQTREYDEFRELWNISTNGDIKAHSIDLQSIGGDGATIRLSDEDGNTSLIINESSGVVAKEGWLVGSSTWRYKLYSNGYIELMGQLVQVMCSKSATIVSGLNEFSGTLYYPSVDGVPIFTEIPFVEATLREVGVSPVAMGYISPTQYNVTLHYLTTGNTANYQAFNVRIYGKTNMTFDDF